MSVERVRAAQDLLGIPWNSEAEALHAGLKPELLEVAAVHWEGRVAVIAVEAAEAEAELLARPVGHSTGGGRRRPAKLSPDESYLGDDNNVRQENE